ncbi:MAG TPA: PEP/pyruvate-binding domain-containing protein [Gemmatimonadaceae bacterium]|nr:PEP/pyruvate-binding domain-containing protein [Gemmatimonadaceae bacterium]
MTLAPPSDPTRAGERARTPRIVWPDAADGAPIGGKAGALAALAASGLRIPAWFAVVPPSQATMSAELRAQIAEAVARLAQGDTDALPDASLAARFAVRSSAREEDGTEHSFAGQFESFLHVDAADVATRVAEVWETARSERVAAYRRERGLAAGGGGASIPAVLVQRMIDPIAAGVAFSADPVSGRRGTCVVSATRGVGSALVSGEVDGDTWEVDRDGAIVARGRASAEGDPSLDEAQVRAVATLARDAARHFGRPQDIEWAVDDGGLWLLQSRPITSLAALPDPDGALALWDNSNITESYGGVTTPLTYSFARYVYEEVYRQFCRIVGVPEARIEENGDALRSMLGLLRGRVYYNLASWYRILALLPGYRLNRAFMEQMMGVREGLPPELEARIVAPSRGERLRDALALARSIVGLVRANRRLPRDIVAFRARLDAALASGEGLDGLRADELVSHYRELERALLRRWDAPLVNDFFAMVFFGVLKKLTVAWCGDTDGTLQNDLVAGEGAIVSAEPARRIIAMAELAAADPALAATLREGTLAEARRAIATHPTLARAVDDYLERFGDRCLEELKLETVTLADDPSLLFRQIGALSASRFPLPAGSPKPSVGSTTQRADAERRAVDALGPNPLRKPIFLWVVRNARDRVRDRENLRFERTRVFGRVRRIVVELGRRYAAVGALDEPRDVFHLTIDEVLGWAAGTAPSADLRGLAAARRAEFQRYHDGEAPDDRFETRGLVHVGHDFRVPASGLRPSALGLEEDGEEGRGPRAEGRRGIGCYPGVVRGRVRVVRDPRAATLAPGEILVAESTDPGWVMLFPSASALLVERGSLLSHSAIVARELGLPAVVSVPGLTAWLATGDEVELDGRTGVVRKLGVGSGASGVEGVK